jgi:hypothetical protein
MVNLSRERAQRRAVKEGYAIGIARAFLNLRACPASGFVLLRRTSSRGKWFLFWSRVELQICRAYGAGKMCSDDGCETEMQPYVLFGTVGRDASQARSTNASSAPLTLTPGEDTGPTVVDIRSFSTEQQDCLSHRTKLKLGLQRNPGS